MSETLDITRANRSALRGAGPRSERTTIEYSSEGTKRTGLNETRIRQATNRGAFHNYYEDLGISTNPYTADVLREQERQFQGNVKEQQGKIDDAKSSYDTSYESYSDSLDDYNDAKNNIPSVGSAVTSSWNDYKSTLTKVRVIGRDDKIEATYYLPKKAAQDSLVGKRGIFASWHNGGTTLNVMGKNYRNQELHDGIRTAAKSHEADYKEVATKKIKGEIATAKENLAGTKAQLDQAAANLNVLKAQIQTGQDSIDLAVSTREEDWAALRERDKARKETLAYIFNEGNI
jgi:hypothetical protein